MIQPEYKNKNNIIFMAFDSIEINLFSNEPNSKFGSFIKLFQTSSISYLPTYLTTELGTTQLKRVYCYLPTVI